MDSKAIWLTPNATSVYLAMWLELGEEPTVMETPPNVLGIIDDHWFKHVADFAEARPCRVPPCRSRSAPARGNAAWAHERAAPQRRARATASGPLSAVANPNREDATTSSW